MLRSRLRRYALRSRSPSLPQAVLCFLAKSRILGFLLNLYSSKERSIYPDISKQIIQRLRLIQRTALSPPAHETALLQWMAEGP
ncbi:hypothetical protein KSP39_PZI016212 [Platanthera zijinensis]|uniref:Uncharacterized protein n=1 Tax=Platanthera zijinensis TaxID=2320716 RepID=A0AAP0B6D8_9ASPA